MISTVDFESLIMPKYFAYKKARNEWCSGNLDRLPARDRDENGVPMEVVDAEKNLAWIMATVLDERNMPRK